EQRLLRAGMLDQQDIDRTHVAAQSEAEAALAEALAEPKPSPADVYEHTYAPSPVDVVYPEDYTGLPA
ncbi:MAG TPA: thiamine pyrophosphate-dependent dehydrogenase E1 component subunit alpha, partial [Gemmataceae bacterium]|nr:thiamine pyrophosphate-dependent dehydrogenase E1 component subunit alpha [Gemmataceae bacterium]